MAAANLQAAARRSGTPETLPRRCIVPTAGPVSEGREEDRLGSRGAGTSRDKRIYRRRPARPTSCNRPANPARNANRSGAYSGPQWRSAR